MPRKKFNGPTSEHYTLFHLQSNHVGQTLSAVLKALLPESSWGQVNHWITRRQVQVNGNLCLDPARRVDAKDVLKLWREPLPKPVSAEQLQLPYIDEHLVVVEKPAGINSVWHREERKLPARRRELQPTLEELMPAAIAKAIGPPPNLRGGNRAGRTKSGRHRPASAQLRWPVFPVHRLDRDTSGLMLFARTRVAEQKLVSMFRDHRIDRQYWAVIAGHVSSQTVRSVFIRDRGDGLRGSLAGSLITSPLSKPGGAFVPSAAEKAAVAHTDGQLAVTHIDLVEIVGSFSVVRCRLETGRTHQIRIHLSELGHPLCGEKTYTRLPNGQTMIDASSAPRQALHAQRLRFTHPLTGERLELTMPLPVDLKRWFTALRSAITDPPSIEQGGSTDEDDEQ